MPYWATWKVVTELMHAQAPHPSRLSPLVIFGASHALVPSRLSLMALGLQGGDFLNLSVLLHFSAHVFCGELSFYVPFWKNKCTEKNYE